MRTMGFQSKDLISSEMFTPELNTHYRQMNGVPPMALSSQDAQRFAETFAGLVGGISQALLDKEPVIRLALTTMFAGGHQLL